MLPEVPEVKAFPSSDLNAPERSQSVSIQEWMETLWLLGPPVSFPCMHCWPTCPPASAATTSPCVFVYRTPPIGGLGKKKKNLDADVRPDTQTRPDVISLWSEAPERLDKQVPPFRIVFGEGIVPAVPPLGPRRQLKRVHFVQHTGGGYEEQMFLSAAVQRSRLKAAHTHVTEDDWLESGAPLARPFLGKRLAVSRRFLKRRAFICCRPQLVFRCSRGVAHIQGAPSGQFGELSVSRYPD